MGDTELEAILADVSTFCLGGEPVPPDLEALWRAQLSENPAHTELLDAYELNLFDAIDGDLFDGFRAEDGVEVPVAAAFDRMVHQVRWVGEILDGSMIGYWVGEQQRRISDSPIVVCDADGQFELGAMTLGEYLLDCTDPEDPEDFIEVRDALEALGIRVAVRNHDEIWDRLEGFEDPNSLVLGYVVEERMRG
jgi:hypothetical protein